MLQPGVGFVNWPWVLAVSVALGADAFSISLAIGLTGIGRRLVLRLTLLVALFHVLMPLAGLVVGQTMGLLLGKIAKFLGATILFWLGGRMLWHIHRPERQTFSLREARQHVMGRRLPAGVSLHGWGIYALVSSVSLDALSVGFSLGTIGSRIGKTVLTMGITAGLMTAAGLVLGRFIGTRFGAKAEFLGGLALVLIGIKLLL